MKAERELILVADKYSYIAANNSSQLRAYFKYNWPYKIFYTGDKNYVLDKSFISLAPDKIMEFLIENPIGNRIKVLGYKLNQEENLSKERLSRSSREYLFFEILDECNLACPWCVVKRSNTNNAETIEEIIQNTKYMTNDFLDYILPYLNKDFIENDERTVFITGGEPLLNINEFKRCYNKIHDSFNSENNRFILLTNGFFIPLNENSKDELFSEIPDVYVELSVKRSIKSQYNNLVKRVNNEPSLNQAYLGERGKVSDFIKIDNNAYFSKLCNIVKYCVNNQIPVRLKIQDKEMKNNRIKVNRNGTDYYETMFEKEFNDYLTQELDQSIIKKVDRLNTGLYDFPDKRHVMNSSFNYEPCSKAKELYISANGRLYPGCAQRMLEEFELPYIGFILEEKRVMA